MAGLCGCPFSRSCYPSCVASQQPDRIISLADFAGERLQALEGIIAPGVQVRGFAAGGLIGAVGRRKGRHGRPHIRECTAGDAAENGGPQQHRLLCPRGEQGFARGIGEKLTHEVELPRAAADDDPLDRCAGCRLRRCWFEPTFHKHVGQLCAGLQIHVDDPAYAHERFRPWRLMALAFKALRQLRPDYPLWREFAYEYEHDRLAIDLLNGGTYLREWVDDPSATAADLDALAAPDEKAWAAEREAVLLYR